MQKKYTASFFLKQPTLRSDIKKEAKLQKDIWLQELARFPEWQSFKMQPDFEMQKRKLLKNILKEYVKELKKLI